MMDPLKRWAKLDTACLCAASNLETIAGWMGSSEYADEIRRVAASLNDARERAALPEDDGLAAYRTIPLPIAPALSGEAHAYATGNR
jgi:hypothetical protein